MSETGPAVPGAATDDRWRLDGRVALVTGASAGLGARFARVLHAAGAHVIVTARRADLLEELAQDCRTRIETITGDITDHAHKLITACNCNFLRKPFDLDDMLNAVAALSPRMQDAAG